MGEDNGGGLGCTSPAKRQARRTEQSAALSAPEAGPEQCYCHSHASEPQREKKPRYLAERFHNSGWGIRDRRAKLSQPHTAPPPRPSAAILGLCVPPTTLPPNGRPPALPPKGCGLGQAPGGGTFLPACGWGHGYHHGRSVGPGGAAWGRREEEEGRRQLERGWRRQGVFGCSPVCIRGGGGVYTGACVRGGVGPVMWSHVFSRVTLQVTLPRCSPGLRRKEQRQTHISTPKPPAHQLGTARLSWPNSVGLGTPPPAHSWGARLSGPCLPLRLLPSLLENWAIKKLSIFPCPCTAFAELQQLAQGEKVALCTTLCVNHNYSSLGLQWYRKAQA